MRYPIGFILELLNWGMTNEETLPNYDDLELEDIRATLLYVAKLGYLKSIREISCRCPFIYAINEFGLLV